MGCDIHVFTEVRDGPEAPWEYTKVMGSRPRWTKEYPFMYDDEDWETKEPIKGLNENPYISRDYALFGVLSQGVRWDCPNALSPRGLPDDMCLEVQRETNRWSGDAHSANWRTLEELLIHQTQLLLLPQNSDNGLVKLQEFISALPKLEGYAPSDIRVVYWFDN